MSEPGPIVLLTRPREGSERFAAALRKACRVPFTISICPLLSIEPLAEIEDLSDYAAVIFTSTHAVAAISGTRKRPDLTAYCVGDRTCAKAKEAGFIAVNGGGTAEALVETVLEANPDGRILHLRGVHAHGQITERLRSCGLMAEEKIVYDQVEIPFDSETNALLRDSQHLIVPVFSARTSRLLSARFTDVHRNPVVIAISEAVAASWTAPASAILISDNPDMDSMLTSVVEAIHSDSPC